MTLAPLAGYPPAYAIDSQFSLHLIRPPGEREVDHVEPRKDPSQNRPQDGAIPLPGTYDGDRRTQAYSRLRDNGGGLFSEQDHWRLRANG